MSKYFLPLAKTSLILVYLVIFAGAAVRMTGSGMGCPDWPKCFGYYIPPTEIETLQYQSGRTYPKGVMIIYQERLYKSKTDYTATQSFDDQQWEMYTRHDYAEFNPRHTWTEYINRLCGALAGVACLFMAIASFGYFKKDKLLVFSSWLVVFLMGFQAWLGATVVFSVLNPIKITVHMVMALVIVAIIIAIIRRAQNKTSIKEYNTTFITLIWVALGLTVIQVVLGTQVREYIDEQVKAGITNEHLWLNNPRLDFYLHRSFSFIVLFVNLYLFYINRKLNLGFNKMKWVLILLILEIFSGITMYYAHFPMGSQAAHLVLATLLFGVQFQLILEARKSYICASNHCDKG